MSDNHDQDKGFKVTDHRASRQDEAGTEQGKEQAKEQECPCGSAGQAASAKEEVKQAYQEAGKPYEHLFPKVTFSTFILSLSSSAMVHMGEVPEPESGVLTPNLPLAKHTIDILAMLKEKTSRCLDADEARLLEGILYELRMTYVVKTQ